MDFPEKLKGYLLVALSGTLWGTGFLYIQYILDHGLRSQDLVSWKMIVGFVTLFLCAFFKDRQLLRIDRKGFLYLVFMAIVCHILYNLAMYAAIERTNIATTVSLMYTAPVFVLLIARVAFKERLTAIKIIAVAICVVGAFLTSTGGSMGVLEADVIGILLGLFTGLCYAIMNLLSKKLLKTYKQLTILIYTFGIAFILSLSFSNPLAAFQLEFDIWFWVNILLLGTVPTALAYTLFTTGLSYNIESSKASIIATIEVPVAAIGAYLIFGQEMFGMKLVGVILVLLSIVILQDDTLLKRFLKKPEQGLYHTGGE